MNWYLHVLKQYANFNGRARRKEYWIFVAFNTLFSIITMLLDNLLGLNFTDTPYGPLYTLYSLALLIPSLAVLTRRLHDVGKSGWMFFVALIPIIGSIWILILLISDSEPGENKYGTNPKNSFTEAN